MKGLFDCLRNRIYREDEDILKQIAANAPVDDSEIEAFEADDEDDEDEWGLGGINIDEIDDADIERVTNEFNMDEGNRAACRLKTIDLKEDVFEEDNVELQPETKLNKKVSADDDMRDFVGAGDGSGHDMKTESFDLIMEEVMEEIELMDEGLMANMREKRLDKKLNKMELKDAKRDRKEGIKQAKDKAKDAKNDAFLNKRADRRQAHAELSAERKAAYNKFAKGADERLFGGGKVRRGIAADKRAGINAAKAEYRNIKRDQILRKKARQVAVEEGVSLDEALNFVLECEQDLLDEGYDYEEIYGEDNVEYQPETKLNKKVSQDPDMRDFVGAGDGSGHDMKTEETDELYDEGLFAKVGETVDNRRRKKMELRDAKYNKLNAKDDEWLRKRDAVRDIKRDSRHAVDAERRNYKVNKRGIERDYKNDRVNIKLDSNARRRDIWRTKKARQVAVEEGVSLDEALNFVLECEQDLLDEGFGYEEIYGEDIFEEDNVELQPETKLNKKVSQDPDMRDFVGAGDGSGHDMKTEAAILAYEEGISLEEAMEWLMEDEEIYDEGLRDNIRATRAAKRAYKAKKKEIWKGTQEDVVDDAIAKLGRDGNDNGVFPTRVDLQDEVYDEGGDPDECAPKRQHQKPVGNVDAVSVDGIDTDDELILGVEAVIKEIEESLDLDDFDC